MALSTTIFASRRRALLILIPVALVVLVAAVLIARWMREQAGIAQFIETYPGEYELPENAPVGFPAWLAWQHFLNAFFLLLIIRSGWIIRTSTRPSLFWSNRLVPKKISINVWLHISLDVLWLLNGLVFLVLLFASGQWLRIVPTSWEVFPNALSVAIQYVSLDWPTENGWINYNSLQLLAYFAIVFLAAPVAILTGVRMSPFWPQKAPRLNKVYPVELARKIHFPTMIFFVLFVIAHVTLVFATGALRNLNHMYATRDDQSWVGAIFFAVSLVIMVAGFIFIRPALMRPVAQLTGNVTRN